MATMAGHKHFTILFSLIDFIFHFLQRKRYEPNPSEMDMNVLIPRRHNKHYFKQKIKCFPILKEYEYANEIIQRICDFVLKYTSGLIAHRLETFILSCSSFLPNGSRTVPYIFCSIFVATLVSEQRRVKRELSRSWLETAQHKCTNWKVIQVKSPEWWRWNTLKSGSLIAVVIKANLLTLSVSLKITALVFGKGGFVLMSTKVIYKYSTNQEIQTDT